MNEEQKKLLENAEIKLEQILEGDPRTFRDPECEYGWIFHAVNEALQYLRQIERGKEYKLF